jgi:hypothetical protein
MLSLPKYQVTGTCSGHAKLLLARKWSKSTNYLIHNIFINRVTSLIAHELARQIYLGFIQIGAELIELQTILRKLTKTRKISFAPSVPTLAVISVGWHGLGVAWTENKINEVVQRIRQNSNIGFGAMTGELA